MNEIQYKTCTACKKSLPLFDFVWLRKKGKHNSSCKSCNDKYKKNSELERLRKNWDGPYTAFCFLPFFASLNAMATAWALLFTSGPFFDPLCNFPCPYSLITFLIFFLASTDNP